MKDLKAGIFFAALATALLGCSRGSEQNPDSAPTGESVETVAADQRADRQADRPIEALADDAVIMSVNGEGFTKHDFDVVQSMYGKIFEYRETGKVGPAASEKVRTQVRSREQLEPLDFMRRSLMRQEARRVGVSISREDVDAAGEKFFADLKSPDKSIGYEDFRRGFNEEELKALDWILEGDLMAEAVRRNAAGGAFEVTEREVDEGEARLRSHDAIVTGTNAVLRAKLESIRARAENGEDFAALARENSQINPDEGEDWGTFELDEFEDSPEAMGWLCMARDGAISPVFDLDDGISVIKVLGRDEDGDLMLARITLYAFDEAPEMTRDEIRKEIEDWKRSEVQKEIFTRLFNEAEIEYPCGTNLFTKATTKDDSTKTKGNEQ